MKKLSISLLLLPSITLAQSRADEILSKAINYHDLHGAWSNLEVVLEFAETRPDGSRRDAEFLINNTLGRFRLSRGEGEVYAISGDSVEVLKGESGPERGLMLRNYYLYLWGLPMKLQDASTPPITYVDQQEINGVLCDVLHIPYEHDTWYFYFEHKSGKMIQYKFYKDEPAGKGELITLEGQVNVQGMLIPQSRSWYTLPEMKYLGTDSLVGTEQIK